MPNIAAVLKAEIARVARKELRAETQELRKLVASQRSQISALRQRLAAAEKQVQRLARSGAKREPAQSREAGDEAQPALRFSAKGLATQRKRLGLSAAALATLLGVSAQSVYKWEDGRARPRNRQLQAIAALRGIGKRAALARLEQLTN